MTMVPIYAILSWMSFMFYSKAVYLTIVELA